MTKKLSRVMKTFSRRIAADHMGAYAATGAYFLMMSFVPFIMILLAISRKASMNTTAIMNALISLVPTGLKSYVTTIINEVYTKSYAVVPVSILILVWSAAKFFHAMTNGLNVINRAKETRGWFYLRFRSMLVVVILMALVLLFMVLRSLGQNVQQTIGTGSEAIAETTVFFHSFRSVFAYVGLILVFLFIYKVLPNCQITFRSQFPGALITATVWMFFSYLISLYYENNKNFNTIYGSLTGVILAMIWLYFCMYFVLFGAELNRIILEDPEENVIITTIEDVKDASEKRRQQIQVVLNENQARKNGRYVYEDYQPRDIEIPWADEDPEPVRQAKKKLRTAARGSIVAGSGMSGYPDRDGEHGSASVVKGGVNE